MYVAFKEYYNYLLSQIVELYECAIRRVSVHTFDISF